MRNRNSIYIKYIIHIKNSILFLVIFTLSTTCLGKVREGKAPSSITLLGGMGSREDIVKIVKKGKLFPPYSYLVGVGYRSQSISFTPIRLNLEGIKHFGKQDSVEVVLYPSIETPTLRLGKLRLSWGIGNGISAMIGPYPKLEKYNSIKSQRVLNFFMLEQNIAVASKPGLQLTLRWHHRCHLFNTIAPQGSGSNFIVVGLRRSL